MCSGSVVITTYDSESAYDSEFAAYDSESATHDSESWEGGWGGDHCTGLTRAFILPSPLRGSTLGTRAAEHKGCTACNWGMQIDWWLQSCTVFQWYPLAYATEMKTIQLHDSIKGLSQKIVSITLHYTTLLKCNLTSILTKFFAWIVYKLVCFLPVIIHWDNTLIALNTLTIHWLDNTLILHWLRNATFNLLGHSFSSLMKKFGLSTYWPTHFYWMQNP